MQSYEELAAQALPKLVGKIRLFARAIIECDFDYVRAYKQVYKVGGVERALNLVSNNTALKEYLAISAARVFIAGRSLAVAKLTAIIKSDKSSVRDQVSAVSELRKLDMKIKREEIEEGINSTGLDVSISFEEKEQEE